MNIITISREFGSGGREVGKRLADALGYAYYDKEIILEIAKESGLDAAYVEHVLQKGITPNYSYTFGRTFYQPVLFPENELKVLSVQQQIIKGLAEKGSCVIVGRGASIILEKYHPFNIFVYADKEAKLARCRNRAPESEHLSDQELVKQMKRIDQGRAKHQRLLSDLRWGDKESYHLCVNTSGVDIKHLIPGIRDYAKAWFGA